MESGALESVKVIRAESLPEVARIGHGFKNDDFVEIRIERVNPASVKLVKIEGTPGKKFSKLLTQTGF